jgi:Putative beta barrel porin-7 (BBP7)
MSFGEVSRLHHPSFPLVKPVINFRHTLCLTLAITVAVSTNAQQTNTRQRSVRQTEQKARASWQPTRPTSVAPATGQPSRSNAVLPASHKNPVQKTKQRVSAKPLRTVGHGVPTPPPESLGSTIIEGPIMEGPIMEGTIIEGPIEHSDEHFYSDGLDGQVVLESIGSTCDAMPGEVCGCDGGCDSMGCGGGTCGGGSDCSCCGELCSTEAWRPCVTLCVPQDGWVSFEYLAWWQDGMQLPPLVTGSTDPNIARARAGVLGDPTTTTLFGGDDSTLDHAFDGGRLRFGVWLNRCHTWGIGAELFQIGEETESFNRTSTGTPILARPFFNTQTGRQDSELVAFPGIVTGTVGVSASSELQGAGVHIRYLQCCDEGCSSWLFCGCKDHYCSRTESMFGWRHLDLTERVAISESLVSTDPANRGTFDILDSFDTRNQFDGVDLGWSYRRTRGFWTFDSLLRLAIGNTRQTVTINGRTTINDPTSTPSVQTLPGGLLAQTSNIGTYKQDEFTVVPEFNANIGFQLTDHLRATFGYTFIYWSNVVRPGDHISTDLNPNLLPPPATPLTGVQRPGFAFDTTDYWVQGLNVGGEFRW